MLTHFDHVTIAVHDLPAAVCAYTLLLGTPPTWRGANPETGAAGALFGQSNALIELVGAGDDSFGGEGLRGWLHAHGEGVQAIAFGTEDAQATSAGLRERGLRATAVQDGEARSTEGVVRTYQSVELSPRATRGLHMLAVQRADTLALRGSLARPADAVDALDHVLISTSDPDAAIALYQDGLGIRLALDRQRGPMRMLFFRVGGVTIEIVQRAAPATTDSFAGLAYRVRDIEGAHARLATAGFTVSEPRDGNKPGTRVFTVRDKTCCVPTLILRDPARD